MINLKNFINYYIECITEESAEAIYGIVPKDNKNPNYFKLKTEKELTTRDPIAFTSQEIIGIKKFITETLKSIPKPTFLYGYPILLIKNLPTEPNKIIPFFFFKINYDSDNNPEIDPNITPEINLEAFNCLNIDKEEVKIFGEKIGLYDENSPNMNLYDYAKKLEDTFEFSILYKGESQSKLQIYETGAIFSSGHALYTDGLIKELSLLIKNTSKVLEESCLSLFLDQDDDDWFKEEVISNQDIIEPFELNDNQREAVKSVFHKKITVVTGPPGTGKSQVVTSILINSVLNGKKVLFSSKNHKAIQVVENKLKELTDKQLVIRLGKRDSEKRDLRSDLIKYIDWLKTSNPEASSTQRLLDTEQLIKSSIEKRNKTFETFETLRKKRNILIKKYNKYRTILSSDKINSEIFKLLTKHKIISKKHLLNCKIKTTANYIKHLNEIHQFVTFEALLDELENNNKSYRSLSKQYIKLWMECLPSKFDNKLKNDLSDYTTILKTFDISGLSKDEIRKIFERKGKIQCKLSDVLNTWCVTNLSINGEIPLIEGFFDLLVIDEASQCDIASVIPLLYRAKNVVVIGDSYQLKHIATLNKKYSIKSLNKNCIPERYEYINNSFYDLAYTICHKNDIIVLNEHFRSHSDIISFSNSRWYDNKLLISTDYSNLNPKPSNDKSVIRWVDINGYIEQENGSGAFIKNEVDEIVKIACELISNANFTGEIGIVSPFRLQVNKIRNSINNTSLKDHQRVRILVATSVMFQGDEKDIMIFSPVVSNNLPTGIRNYLESTEHLLNVSITRARSELIIVGDLNACLKSDIGYISKFAHYVKDMTEGKLQNIELKSESPYEEILHYALIEAGIKPIPQYALGQYRLDFAIIKNDLKLDIEVDGKEFHTDWEGERLKSDLIRNQRLQNLGWKVLRFWSYEIKDSIEYCVNRIKAELDKG